MAFVLTTRGESEVEEIQNVKSPEGAILAYLYEKGKEPVEVEDIISKTKMGEEKAIRVLTRLVNTGYIEEV